MKRKWVRVLFSIAFLWAIAVVPSLFLSKAAAADDVTADYQALKADLEKSGVAAKEVDNISKPLKEMLKQGARKDELKKAVLELSQKGVSGSDMKKAVNSMNDLVKSGEAPKQAGNVVSRAAKQAHAQGLKGKELAAKVHEAIRQRKTEIEQLKKKVKEKEKEAKAKTEKAKKEAGKGLDSLKKKQW